MMCKFQKFTVLTILILAIGFFIGSYLFSSVWLSTSSPNKTYKVELTGNKERGGFIIPSVVGYKVIKENQVIAENSSIHSGDWMDISFELAYPEHTWISENVIRFWRNSHLPEEKDKTDTLLISNDTDKTIKYLEVKARDMFLIFGIQPRSTLGLSVTHQSWDSGVRVEGEFEDGNDIAEYDAGFIHRNTLNELLVFCASINYNFVKIQSPQLEGYDRNGNLENLNIPKSANCAP